jgi:hypothetical protein
MYTTWVLVAQLRWPHGCSAMTVWIGGMPLPTQEQGIVTGMTSKQFATVQSVGLAGGHGSCIV